MTLKQAFDSFMLYGKAYWSPKTCIFYEKNVGYFLRYLRVELDYCVDELVLQELRPTILFEYLIYLRSKQKYDNHPLYHSMSVNGTIKANTVNSYMRAVKAFFNYLYNQKYTAVRYTDGLKLPKSDSDQIVVLTQQEAESIFRIFDYTIPPRICGMLVLYPLCWKLASAGPR